jgi:hypothetical protein
MAPNVITVVSGLPRSGTSLMMQMLEAGGLPLLTDNVRLPDENNPRGYFEFEPVKQLRVDQSWLGQACGRAVKIIHLLVRELPDDGRFEYRVILMKRPMDEILSSQRLMLERQGKISGDRGLLASAFRDQLSKLEKWLKAQPHFKTLSIDYHDVIAKPKIVANDVDNFVGGGLDTEAMARAVDPALYRQRL